MKKTVVTGIVIAAALAGGVWYLKQSKMPAEIDPALVSSWTKGPDHAKVTIVEYSDFECPACQRSQAILDSIMQQFDGKVKLVFRHFPLPGHLWSAVAHQAAECAGAQGKFWSYHDKLYGNQGMWSGPANPTEHFLRFAKEENLDLDSFAVCLADKTIKEKIHRQKEQGDLQKVNSTPTFFINGERFVGQIQLDVEGRKFIEHQLK